MGGPLEHVIAAKAVAFGEALTDEFVQYQIQTAKNAQVLAGAMVEKGFKIISGGTDNHLMLIDLRNKNVSGKLAENALVKADITANKNMVPYDDKSPFVTSGIRLSGSNLAWYERIRYVANCHMDRSLNFRCRKRDLDCCY